MKVHGTGQSVQPTPRPLHTSSKGQEEDFSSRLGQECLLSVNNATAKTLLASSIAPPPPPQSAIEPKTTMRNAMSAYKARTQIQAMPQIHARAQTQTQPNSQLQIHARAQTQTQANSQLQTQTPAQAQPAISSLRKYADDQLLNNPGGDQYDLSAKVVEPKSAHPFTQRVGKDVKDVFGNVKNLFANMFFGAKFCYRDENGQVQEARKKGLLGSVTDFFKDLGSALSLGAWRPEGDPEPQGVGGRLKFAGSKLFKAFSTDILQNVPGSLNHMVEDVALAGLNLIETVPDATIGNLAAGEGAVTKGFDGAQVLVNYVTDIAPGGEAWQRVHAMSFKDLKPPILNNLTKPERGTEDPRWRYIRNTRFRKGIETVGALLSDILTFGFVRWIGSSSEKTHHRN